MEHKYFYPKEEKQNKKGKKSQKEKKQKKKSKSNSKNKKKSNKDTIEIKITKNPNKKIQTEKTTKEKEITIMNETSNLIEEEKRSLINNVIGELEYEKIDIKNYNLKEEDTDNNKESEKKHVAKKYLSIDVEENIDSINQTNNEANNFLLEVKNRKFDVFTNLSNRVLYDGYEFYEDSHRPNNYPKTINYRCSNYRKNQRTRTSQFCNALLKRKTEKNTIYFVLEKPHSVECLECHTKNKKIETNLIGNYNDYINKCFKYLDSTEEYNKKDFKLKLQNIYNENKYDFRLKENTIKNIIGRWKNNSLRFTKYNAIENRFNKNNELILWEYNNIGIFTSNNKFPFPSEYFIWTSDPIIARSRLTNHLFIDGTFHHPIGFEQLLIIIFKDIVTSDYLPCFYILMSNKTEILYDLIFKSVKRILTQNNIYQLSIKTITTDTELALINAVKLNFPQSQRIGCWFHLKQDLMKQSRILGLLNPKNIKTTPDITLEVITQLSILPIEFDGDIEKLINKLDILSKQYPYYYNMINGYFKETKLKYFKDGSFNYNKFPKDIRANSILERYNKTVKKDLGTKRTCNWVIFLNFINNEINRINEQLSKNENINVLYNSKLTKFGTEKYTNIDKIEEGKDNNNESNHIENLSEVTEPNKWLVQKGNNCRYNAFITLFYFTIAPFVNEKKEYNNLLLGELNKKILNLALDINDNNYNEIIIFLQKNKFDANNAKIDEIIKEKDEIKKEQLIKQLKVDDSIDFTSSGYAAQLFSIFNNNLDFCFKENKTTECILCGKKSLEEINEMQPFIFINSNNIKNTSIFNLLLDKYKEIHSYACDCRKNSKEDVLCLKIKYNIMSYPVFLFLLFDFQYSELVKYKDNIYKLLDDKIALNIKIDYKLIGLIAAPSKNHYNTIIFNPLGSTINSYFSSNNIYYHDGMLNDGHILALNKGEDWKKIGIPYIALYKKLEI